MANPIGEQGESLARKIYEQRGFEILAANFFNRKGKRLGEIDFIAAKNQQLHFVEVKTRSNNFFGTGAESITFQKKAKILKAVQIFFLLNPQLRQFKAHIDVVSIEIKAFDKKPRKIKIYSDAIGDIY